MPKVSCRKAFTSTLLKLARKDSSIYAIATDSRGSVTLSAFADALPSQFVEMGIAEQNALAFAAGLASVFRNVFVTGPACFLCARGFEQIKVDAAYNKSNVKIVGVSAGVSYGPLGGTHTTLHDFASLRALPNIQIFAPSDAVQTEAITRYLADRHGPAYMRTGRGDVEQIYGPGENFEIGRAKEVCPGKDIAIIACGELVHYAKQAAEELLKEGLRVRVLDMFTLKPFDEDAVVRAARETGRIITLEEHSVNGGLGELVTHITSEHCPVPVKILGFPDEEYKAGKSAELFAHYGLDTAGIIRTLRAFTSRSSLGRN
jgi:transketolase